MEQDWKDYALAARDPRFWWAALDIMNGGWGVRALGVALVDGAIAILQIGSGGNVSGIHSGWWVAGAVGGLWLGTVLYAARNKWHAERGGESAEALEALESIPVPVYHAPMTARDVIGQWGENLVNFQQMSRVQSEVVDTFSRGRFEGKMPRVADSEEATDRFFTGFAMMERELDIQDLLEHQARTDGPYVKWKPKGLAVFRAARGLTAERRRSWGLP